MVLNEITYFPLLGIPFIVYLGIITFSTFLFAALIVMLPRMGITKIHLKWHPRMAKIGLILAAMHGLLALLAYF